MYGKRIRELRKSKNLTMKELGKKLSLAESTISGYENETRKPDIEIIEKMADFFGVDVDDLLGRKIKNEQNIDIDDPELGILFYELKEATPEIRERARDFLRYLKDAEKDRKPGDNQGEIQ
ncbi:helix-turn-helix domain-containing protein [Paenibacillus sp. RC84]|uniref:helix-turn-helix domain-containing protein n=1 Tax=Paenibacillus sp. RC84 TaxID=3156252 RepID=UPI003512F89E